MWSREFYHIFRILSRAAIGGICGEKEACATFREVEPVWCSSSQTRRPTNWATPGYLIMKKCSLWSNMWSGKFYHILRKHSRAVIGGNWGETGECTTFREVEPVWCSSTQSRRATNCATPGYSVFYPAGRILPMQARYQTSLSPGICFYT